MRRSFENLGAYMAGWLRDIWGRMSFPYMEIMSWGLSFNHGRPIFNRISAVVLLYKFTALSIYKTSSQLKKNVVSHI
jgi:hypothetical protein